MHHFYCFATKRFSTWALSLCLVLLSAVFGTAAAQRVTYNLVSIYDFQEGSGSVVHDVSGNSPIDLTIQHPGNVTWLSGGGLRVNSGTIIKSAGAATRMHTALNASGEFSFEAWIKPDNASQAGPARIATMSSNTSNRNFMLGQDGSNYAFRSRTTSGGDSNGLPQISASPSVVNLQHVVYTWNSGTEKLYINGQLKYTGTRNGNLTNWNSSYAFALCNEMTLDRAWLGDLHLVAVYCQELDLSEVNQNFNEGPGIDYGTPTLDEACNLTGYESTTGRIFWLPLYATDFAPLNGGLTFTKYTNGTAHMTGTVASLANSNNKWNVDLWFNYKMNYTQWSAQGGDVKEPQLGDESFWTFYDFDKKRINVLTGQGNLAGQKIFLYKMPTNSYGVQIGDGANALTTAANGLSAWFNYFGSQNDHGDINATINCTPPCDANLTGLVIRNTSSGATSTLVNGGTYSLSSLPTNWNIEALTSGSAESVRFTFSGNTSAVYTENASPYRAPGDNVNLNLAAGTYSLNVKVYTADNCTGVLCDEETISFTITGCDNATNGGQIGYSQSGCIGYDPVAFTSISAPTGGSGALQIIWIKKSASTNWNYVEIPGATGLTYDSGSLTETTTFRRCARREFCSSYVAESNEITVTVSGACCSNVTNGGQIGYNQSGCVGFDPAEIGSISSPAGGSGALEIIWMKKSASTGWNFQTISGATALSYNPGVITETTIYRRCARRAGCVEYAGESNDVTVTITTASFTIEVEGTDATCGTACDGSATVTVDDESFDSDNDGWNDCYDNDDDNDGWYDNEDDDDNNDGNYDWDCDNDGWWNNWWDAYGNDYSDDDDDNDWYNDDQDNDDDNDGLEDCIDPDNDYDHDGYDNCDDDDDDNDGDHDGEDNDCDNDGIDNDHDNHYVNYTYLWSNGATTRTISGLCAGTYTVTVTKGNGCSLTATVTIGQEEGFELQTTVTNVSCLDECDGSASVTIIGGAHDSDGDGVCNYTDDDDDNDGENDSDDCDDNNDGHHDHDSDGDGCWDNYWSHNGWSLFGGNWWNGGWNSGYNDCDDDNDGHNDNEDDDDDNDGIEDCWDEDSDYDNDGWCNADDSDDDNDGINDNNDNDCNNNGQDDDNEQHNCGYTYLWSNGATTSTVTGLCAGTHTVTVTDANGCSKTVTVNVTGEPCDNCDLVVNAGPDREICGPVSITLTSTITGASNCEIPGTSDCNHTLVAQGGWLESPSYAAACGQVYGTKLWTASGNGTSFVTLDFGTTVPAGTQICANMKLEHCSNTSSNNSSAKIQASTSLNSGYYTVVAAQTFNNTPYQEFCYTLTQPARYVKVSDNGQCAFRLDYVEYTTPGTPSSPVTYSWSGPGIVGANNGATISVNAAGTYVVTVTDCEQCSATDTVVVTNDDEDPIFTSNQQSNYNLECGTSVPMIQPTATDNNGAVTYTYVDQNVCVYPSANCNCTQTRIWTATDLCGNSSTFTQYFNFTDSTPPVLVGVPVNYNATCGVAPTVPTVSATDNCDNNVTVTMTENIVSASCPIQMTRTWLAVDNCGNQISATQTIYINDTVNPVLVNVPANAEVNCDEIPAAANVTATDNCGTANVEFTETSTEGCPYTITRTWVAEDACGNMASATQILTVVDNEDPTLVGVPASVQAQCGVAPAVPTVTANDNCDTDVMVEYSQQIISESCPIHIIRTWTATDNCNNVSTASQTIYIHDTIDPVLHGVPANVTVQCDAVPNPANVTVTDNCGNDLEVVYNQTSTQGCPYTITRTWSAVDACGNEVSATQVIEVIDTVFPTLIGVPADTTIECNTPIMDAVVTSWDNCSVSLPVSLSAETIEMDCGYKFIRTWTVTDLCGNVTTASQEITVTDTQDPYVVIAPPAELWIECDENEPTSIVEFGDDCDQDLTLNAISGIANVTACGYDIQKVWSAMDDCGNAISVSQVIHVRDTTNPELVGVPANDTVSCDAIPAPANVTATDNCSTPAVSMEETATEGCPYTITRVWTAIDSCGNSSSATQILTVIDTVDPTFDSIPPAITVECDAVPAADMLTASDNCDTDVEVTFNEVMTSGTCTYYLYRTWTATDNCGNQTTAQQIVTVVDTTFPELIGVPSDIEVECDAVPAPAVVTASDNCTDELEVAFAEGYAPNECGYTLTRMWSVTDYCNHTTTATQVIVVRDTQNPQLIGVPADETIECTEEISDALVIATDNCDTTLDVQLTAETIEMECGYQFVRTWFVQDDCGNSATATQTITVVDTQDPIIVSAPAAELWYECDQIVPTLEVLFTDSCDQDLSYSAISGIANVSECGYDIQRSIRATDDCGNYTVFSQVVHVRDTTDPELVGVPANDTVACDAIPAPANVTATDNCGDATVEMVEVATEGCPYTITRTWTATDLCGNTSTAVQVLNVIDEVDPQLIGVPANYQAQCGEAPAVANVTGSDNCDTNVEVVFSQQVISSYCPIQIIRTWTATDNCGNSVSASQTIYINDTVDPTLHGVPANITVECDAVPAPANVTATDNCASEMEVGFNESTVDQACGYVLVRTWQVSDYCGNTTTRSQMITVVDTTAPELTGEDEEMTFQCNMAPGVVAPTASDNCDDNVTVVPGYQMIAGDCANSWTEVYTWTAIDDCGNETVRTIIHHFVDTMQPELVGVPADVTAPCDNVPAAANVTAIDNCDTDVEVTLDEVYAGTCPYTITRTWTAVDNCGNTISATQVVTVVDEVNPYFTSVPADMTLECTDIVPATFAYASDICDTDVTVTMEESIDELVCGSVITRTWTATDNCGNQAQATQVITITDSVDPYVISAPAAELTVLCSENIPMFTPEFGDLCDTDLNVEFISGIANQSNCGYDVERVWTATDNCDNSVSVYQVIHVVDTIAPYFTTELENLTVECSNIPSAAEVTAEDLCGAVSIDYNQEVVPGDSCTYTIVRTWTASDICGNESYLSQTLTVVDTTSPSVDFVPAELTVECGDEIPYVAAIFSDNCDTNLTLSAISGIANVTDCGYDIERVWFATDNCGNTNSASQIIHVVDTTYPTLNGVPADATVECTNIPAIAEVTGSDNCDENVTITYEEVTETLECGKIITRTWTATDNCGWATSESQVITVIDETAPFVVSEPADATYLCNQTIAYVVPVFDDNCDDNLAVTYDAVEEAQDCGYTITRTWTATDDCGNSFSVSQLITVTDTIAPVISGPPAMIASCNATAYDLNISATDNCGGEVELTYTDMVFSGGCQGHVERTWTATDNCGNSSIFYQIILMIDEELPTVAVEPQDLNLECDMAIPAFTPEFSDNCDDNLEISYNEVTETIECGYRITRVWVAVDNCENELIVDQVITVTDNTAPVLSGVPANEVVMCNTIPAVAVVTAEDNCDEVVEVQFNETETELACGYMLTRTWTVSDDCGNMNSAVQYITVTDSIAPTLYNVPADLEVVCGSPIPGVSTDVYATDNCTFGLTVDVQESEVMVDCERVITRVYSVVDACGNETSQTQTITVIDNVIPQFNMNVYDATVNCGEIPAIPVVTASDNCDTDVEVLYDEIVSDGCPYTILRTWTAIDNCGNEMSMTQLITVVDNENPVFDAYFPYVQVECEQVGSYMLTATDNCDSDLDIQIVSELVFSGQCYGTLERTYRATDNCGNWVEAIQLIDIIDSTDPTFDVVPTANITITCDDDIPAVPTGIIASDNCDSNVEVTYTETQTNSFCPFDIIRTWTAIDNCNNVSQVSQVITVTVQTAPAFHLSAYPNPTSGEVTIEFSSPKPGKLDAGLYDVAGRKVETIYQGEADGARLYRYSFDASQWNSGAYSIRVISEDGVHQQKLIVTSK